jgi:predicted glycosyltransferase
MPGSRIAIVSEDQLKVETPDYVVIFPWNLSGEIADQLKYLSSNGTKFVTAVPRLEIFK